jgi:hypothetical protein
MEYEVWDEFVPGFLPFFLTTIGDHAVVLG